MNKKKKLKLTIELVPATSWFQSLFQLCQKTNQQEEWKKIKETLFKKEGRKCWICGAENTRLEAHEFWEYDYKNKVQKLKEIHHLCHMCHKIKHIGFWCYTDEGKLLLKKQGLSKKDLIKHFCKVNNCTPENFYEHEKEAFELWEKRNQIDWKIDLGNFNYLKQPAETQKTRTTKHFTRHKKHLKKLKK